MMWSVRCAIVLSLCVLYTSGRRFGSYLALNENDVCKPEGGNEWICRKLNNCRKASEMYNAGNTSRIELCRFYKNEPIVCCEPEIKVKSISQRKCEEYGAAVYVKPEPSSESSEAEDTCAANGIPYITNGQDTAPREYPHMALIGYGKKNNITYRCGGSLISERYILSAAHCSNFVGDLPTWARLGEYNRYSTTDEDNQDSSPEEYEIVQHINHPEYRPPKIYNDIALYKLSRDVVFNAFIRPCCLNYNPEKNYDEAVATGWGVTENGNQSDCLMEVKLAIRNTSECNRSYGANLALPNAILNQSMLCAGGLSNKKDTCQGDSGGPLQILLKEPYCMYSVLGVTSFGYECGGHTPAVYTRVSHFIPWIESIVWSS